MSPEQTYSTGSKKNLNMLFRMGVDTVWIHSAGIPLPVYIVFVGNTNKICKNMYRYRISGNININFSNS